jgi:hypothetical protein
MKHIIAPAALAACMLASAGVAQQSDKDTDTGPSLMERGAELFWEGLRQEMAPALEEFQGLMATIGPSMQDFLTEMGPALAEIADQVEDWSRYEAPEILPNGDIIIRRKPAELQPPIPEPQTEGRDSQSDGATDI